MGRSNINLVGNTTTGQNLGDGACVFKCKSSGNNLQFKTISATGSTQIFETADKLVIFSTGGSGTTYSFSNGLTQNINAISLGGNLTEDIVISGGSASCNFSVLGVTDLKLNAVSGMYLCGLPTKSSETCAVYIDANGKLATGLAGEGGGSITGATNLALGVGEIYTSVSNGNIQLKILSGGTNVTLSSNDTHITINSTGSITGGTNGLGTTDKLIKLGGTLTETTTINGSQQLKINVSSIDLTGSTAVNITGLATLQSTPSTAALTDSVLMWNSEDKQIKKIATTGITSGGFLGLVTQTTAEPSNLKDNQWVKPSPTVGGVFNYTFTNFCDNTATPISVNLSLEDVTLRYRAAGDYWTKESFNRPITSGTTWIGNATSNCVCEVPVIDEWVTSEANLAHIGQKFAYETHTVFQTDVGTCTLIPNYIFCKNIDLKTIGNTLITTIPAGKRILLNHAKLIVQNSVTSSTGFAVQMGNHCLSNCYNNLISKYCIDDALAYNTYELPVLQKTIGIDTPNYCCAQIYFRVSSGATSVSSVTAHLLVEGFLY